MPLRIRVGPGRHVELLQECLVNQDATPVHVSSEHFEGYITVRVKNYRHHEQHQTLAGSAEKRSCVYFDGKSRIFSIQWQGRFNATNKAHPQGYWTANDVLLTAEVEEKIQPLPMGLLPIATRFIKLIDPSFFTYGISKERRPWIGSFLVTAMNVLTIWDSAGAKKEVRGTDMGMDESEGKGDSIIGPWMHYGTNRLEEANVHRLIDTLSTSCHATHTTKKSVKGLSGNKRRRFFMDAQQRQAAVFHPSLVIAGDFYNNFTDFVNQRAKMVVSFQMDQVLGRQPLRFVCRSQSRESSLMVGGADDDGGGAGHGRQGRRNSHLAGGEGGWTGSGDGDGGDKALDDSEEDGDGAVFFVVQLDWED